MNVLLKIFTLSLVFTLTACMNFGKATKISYLSLEMPKGVIKTTKVEGDKILDSSRISVGLYRPPANVDAIIKEAQTKTNTTIFKDVDIVFQTPFCVVPFICNGNDKFVRVDAEKKDKDLAKK